MPTPKKDDETVPEQTKPSEQIIPPQGEKYLREIANIEDIPDGRDDETNSENQESA